MPYDWIQSLALALALGMLVGLERQWAKEPVAGIRTFPLVTLLGVLAGQLGQLQSPWIVSAGLLGLLGVLLIGNLAALRQVASEPSVTTEVAALVMYLVGNLLVLGQVGFAVTVTGSVLVLLHSKRLLHGLAERMGEADFRAITRLVLIALVILPALPDRAYGPYGVLNPFRIWTMVVLIVGISTAAYVVQRALGARGGMLLAAGMGGLISSTAATIGYSRRARGAPELASSLALQIQIASTVVVARVIFEVAVVAPMHLTTILGPLVALLLFMGGIAMLCVWLARKQPAPPPESEAPSDLKGAILFGALYALVLLGVAWAKDVYGARGIYVVAALSGTTDVDAITLSTARLLKGGQLDQDTAWRVIILGAMANLCFKAGVVAVLGSGRLLARVAVLFGLSLAGGVALLYFWR